MRKLDPEERAILRTLDAGVSTPDLIAMVRDLGEILRSRGHVVQANVAELAADRLMALSISSDDAAAPRSGAARPNAPDKRKA
jgi:hypothetical protein